MENYVNCLTALQIVEYFASLRLNRSGCSCDCCRRRLATGFALRFSENISRPSVIFTSHAELMLCRTLRTVRHRQSVQYCRRVGTQCGCDTVPTYAANEDSADS
jgi:hypothetical protein